MSFQESYEAALRSLKGGDLRSAEKQTRRALEFNPNNGSCLNVLGAIRILQGEHHVAAKFFADACAQMPMETGPRINRAAALNKAGRFVEAAHSYLDAIRIDPASVDRVAAESHYTQLGKGALKAPDIEFAAEAFVAASMFNPGAINSPALTAKDTRDSVSLFAAMHRRAPDNPAIEEKFAYALHQSGQIEESRRAFEHLTIQLAHNEAPLKAFHDAYSEGLIATGSNPRFHRRQRFESLSKILSRVIDLRGAIAECGCARGLSAFVIGSLFRFQDPLFRGGGFHIFDSFEGLSEPTTRDRDGAVGSAKTNMVKGQFAAKLDLVRRNLASFPEIEFHPGWIPSRFADVADLEFKFLNLDVDLYEPTRDSIKFFYPRLVSGGLIVSDDYNWPGCRAAIDECAAQLGFDVELTTHNQAIITKQ